MQLQNQHILVEQTDPEHKSKGGLFIPEYLLQPRNRGIIAQVGTNVDNSLIGKEVLFILAAAQNITIDQKKYKLLFLTDLISTLN